MAEFVIRKGIAEDIDGIVRLEQVCFASPWSEKSLNRDLTENEMAVYIVAELAGQIVGYVGIWIVADEGHINNVAVSPLYRRQHIGSALIDAMIKTARHAGVKSYTLEVRAGNEPAKNLYKKSGFQEAGLRKGYYEDNREDAVIMWRY